VIETSSTNTPSLTESPVTRIIWIVLIVVTLGVCYFSQLGAIGFVGPDEPRYAWIARAMAESGDWVTPRLYGQPWFEKPVLYYWEAAVSFKIFGVSEAAARLPGAVSALVGTLALGWLAWQVYGAATARWFLILLPTSVGMIGFSHAAATDMPFAGMLTVAMVCAAVVLGLAGNSGANAAKGRKDDDAISITSEQAGAQHAAPLQRLLALTLFGVFLGLAVLAKGPAAIILCGGAVFFWAIFTKCWLDALRLLHPVAILAFCVTALPWYVICARRNPDFFRIFIIEHNFKRYLTPEFQHVQPFWFYVPVLLVAFLPWLALFAWSAVVGIRGLLQRRGAGDLALFLICWAGFCVLFFSTSHSKLPGYILPAFPAIGLLMARSVVSLKGIRERSFRYANLAIGAILVLLFALSELFTRKKPLVDAKIDDAVAIIFGLFGIANLTIGLSRFIESRGRGTATTTLAAEVATEATRLPRAGQERHAPLLALAAATPILVAVLLTGRLIPEFFFRDPSARTIAREVQRQGISGKLISVAGMNRGLQYGLSFYLHEEIQNWNQQSETGGYLLTGSKNCEAVVGAGFYCESQPFDSDRTGRFLYLVIPLAGGKKK
jgi:4-amino-4-deoxy-L-arabinose transferase-like glycosyltransferase